MSACNINEDPFMDDPVDSTADMASHAAAADASAGTNAAAVDNATAMHTGDDASTDASGDAVSETSDDTGENAATAVTGGITTGAAMTSSGEVPDSTAEKFVFAMRLTCNILRIWYPLDARDHALLTAQPADWVRYGFRHSFIRRLNYRQPGMAPRVQGTEWTESNNDSCMRLVAQAGGELSGFADFRVPEFVWESMLIRIRVAPAPSSTPRSPFNTLVTLPSNIRIYRGPNAVCPNHHWDAMIVRNCLATDDLGDDPNISSSRWDVLLMKVCPRFEHPWFVINVREVPDLM
ncbi:hypothetical protein AAE478_006740 [Parahypoxylon ruwenzoriense]